MGIINYLLGIHHTKPSRKRKTKRKGSKMSRKRNTAHERKLRQQVIDAQKAYAEAAADSFR